MPVRRDVWLFTFAIVLPHGCAAGPAVFVWPASSPGTGLSVASSCFLEPGAIPMPVAVSYPGVYIEEVPSGVRTIAGVATSITAFIGYTARGPINKGVQIFNFGDYERAFGGLQADAPLSYAVQQFFGNGGAQAIIVRVAAGAARAAIGLRSEVGGPGIVVLTATARSEGRWGNGLRIDVDYDSANAASLFNLTVTEFVDRCFFDDPARTETHRNLSMSQFSGSYAVNVINAASELIEVARPAAAGTAVALVNGNG